MLFCLFFRYFYTDEVNVNNLEDIKKTKEIADRFQVTKLSQICVDKLNKYLSDMTLNISNVCDVLKTSKEFKNEEKEKECMKFIGENWKAMIEEIKDLPVTEFMDIVLQLNRMGLICEKYSFHLKIFPVNAPNKKNCENIALVLQDSTTNSSGEHIHIPKSCIDSSNQTDLSTNLSEKVSIFFLLKYVFLY